MTTNNPVVAIRRTARKGLSDGSSIPVRYAVHWIDEDTGFSHAAVLTGTSEQDIRGQVSAFAHVNSRTIRRVVG